MQRRIGWTIAIVWALFSSWAYGQDPKTEIQNKLNSQFVLTRFTVDHTDIVKAGSVLVLQKEGLVMFSSDTNPPPTSTYKNGKLSLGFGSSLVALRTGDQKVPQRTFVQGEKFWLAATEVRDDGIYLLVISDPFNNIRYKTQLKFPFNKKPPQSADDMMKEIAEVVTPDSGSDQNTAQQQQPPPQQHQPPPPAAPPQNSALAPIAPPPPPADAPPPQPKTISIGQTKDVVVAILGQPQKDVKLGTKEIFVYPDLKVTFVNNKVSDVQ
jgi:hypothetical protein